MKKNKQLPIVLLATRNAEVISSFPDDQFQALEANTTIGLANAILKNPVLIVADLDTVLEAGNLALQVVRTTLDNLSQNMVISSAQFLAEPQRYIGEALMAGGQRSGIRFMPPRVVMITNYCGGVGKTTLSLALARAFRKDSGLPAAIVEAGVGGSSLNARIGQHTSLYDVVTQNAKAQEWSGVSVYPCDTWEAETLAADERIQAALQAIAHENTVTVFDTFPTNPLWKWTIEMATDVIVVATPRPDALAQAEVVLRRLAEETSALDPKPRIHLVLNQVQTLGERLSMARRASALVEFDQRRADWLDGVLAKPLVELLYPGWKK